ncbi:MAG: cell division protein ZipA C-terminal FtsZ-binding domain-containing protein [Gammaproteobacteria bacterium]|nr:cell division protein ZipA C-terminal FtsZ-binding domain-containing protein [Gammaproteobacteria bacterium]MCI0590956.1 cell division protein ZipA C-terminal FtsZ-binding domain-containing protein [Gammaproteobacteria bacterium]
MTDLRLLLLGIGLLIIAGIYLWENAKLHRKKYRGEPKIKQEDDLTDLVIAPRPNVEIHDTDVLSAPGRPLSASKMDSFAHATSSDAIIMAADIDDDDDDSVLHDSTYIAAQGNEDKALAAAKLDSADKHIVLLYITAPHDETYSGSEIVKAAEAVGMKYGHMGIFHYYGAKAKSSELPLFSLANMFEPGKFDLAHIQDLVTQGLVLFMCLPTPISGPDAFALMSDTATRLVEILGGDVRGADHDLIDEAHIDEIHARIVAVDKGQQSPIVSGRK